jgi:hypothetical protein
MSFAGFTAPVPWRGRSSGVGQAVPMAAYRLNLTIANQYLARMNEATAG